MTPAGSTIRGRFRHRNGDPFAAPQGRRTRRPAIQGRCRSGDTVGRLPHPRGRTLTQGFVAARPVIDIPTTETLPDASYPRHARRSSGWRRPASFARSSSGAGGTAPGRRRHSSTCSTSSNSRRSRPPAAPNRGGRHRGRSQAEALGAGAAPAAGPLVGQSRRPPMTRPPPRSLTALPRLRILWQHRRGPP